MKNGNTIRTTLHKEGNGVLITYKFRPRKMLEVKTEHCPRTYLSTLGEEEIISVSKQIDKGELLEGAKIYSQHYSNPKELKIEKR